jgi:hypothetical protein
VILGALLADTPHTRPVPVSGAAYSPESARLFGLEETRYEGPTGIAGGVSIRLRGGRYPGGDVLGGGTALCVAPAEPEGHGGAAASCRGRARHRGAAGRSAAARRGVGAGDLYVNTLKQHILGLTSTDNFASMIRLGHALCDALQAGTSRAALHDQLVTRGSYSDSEASWIITGAVASYCPNVGA